MGTLHCNASNKCIFLHLYHAYLYTTEKLEKDFVAQSTNIKHSVLYTKYKNQKSIYITIEIHYY